MESCDLMALDILSKEKFSKDVDTFINENKCDIMDAILNICKQRNLEIESVSNLLTHDLKTRLEMELEGLNLLKLKKARLPV